MNHSIYSADRATHLKIVVVALVCATAVAGIGVAARVGNVGPAGLTTARLQGTGPILRAGQPVAVTQRDDTPIVH